MRNPEERSPQEWADDLRIDTGCDSYAREFTRDDCDELAARMDDLAEALRLLRDITGDDVEYAQAHGAARQVRGGPGR